MNTFSVAELFEQAMASLPKQCRVEFAGARLNILEWGDVDKPGLLFIHGGAAHANWWRFIAPHFLPDYHCIAVDLSGHGDSAKRTTYSADLWRKEVSELVCEHSFFQSKPIIIGHSMGGLVGLRVAAEAFDLPGLVVIDSAVREVVSKKSKPHKTHNLLGKQRVYNSRQQAQSRFRLIPPQPVNNQILLDFIAAESIEEFEGGWTWKYDPAAFRDLQASSIFSELKKIQCPTLILRGQHSKILDLKTAQNMQSEIGNTCDLIDISEAYHHVLLDQPVALIEEIKRALKRWRS